MLCRLTNTLDCVHNVLHHPPVVPFSMSHDTPPPPGTVFKLPLRKLHYNPFIPIPGENDIDDVWQGTTEDWFNDTINNAPVEIQAWAAGAPALTSVMADFVKLALMLMPQRPDNSAVMRMELDGTLYTGNKTARQWLWINTEAIQGREWVLVVFLQPVLISWHPYVQLPTVSRDVAKTFAMLLYWEVQAWSKAACARWIHEADPEGDNDPPDTPTEPSSHVNPAGLGVEILP